MEAETSNAPLGLDEKEIRGLVVSQKILFGHMSVGGNIMEGLEELQPLNRALSPKEIRDGSEIAGNGIYHIKNGPNGDAIKKCDNFKSLLLQDNLGSTLDVALFKFCYVDIDKHTDIRALFDHYVSTIDGLRAKLPSLSFVHVTVPFFVHNRGLKSRIKNVLQGDQNNIQRHRFNEMLKEKYKGVDPIYDLAAVESTLPDGSRETFRWKGKSWYALFPGYTTDGGHLNEAGRRAAAAELLRVLAGTGQER